METWPESARAASIAERLSSRTDMGEPSGEPAGPTRACFSLSASSSLIASLSSTDARSSSSREIDRTRRIAFGTTFSETVPGGVLCLRSCGSSFCMEVVFLKLCSASSLQGSWWSRVLAWSSCRSGTLTLTADVPCTTNVVAT
eukprot:CAMPEP_0119056094 /NCGR_PEP_ID=MMETSP1178-20130426/801_1 /TAXON_ID=33656 /ORGANISM="unid sp, Strain CCMP2000" /LENGTH=142 /DNA_ID=CAMNT_0007036787 /DNA_START=307 /DNA_END=735 /DNA_ORIENTATION=-